MSAPAPDEFQDDDHRLDESPADRVGRLARREGEEVLDREKNTKRPPRYKEKRKALKEKNCLAKEFDYRFWQHYAISAYNKCIRAAGPKGIPVQRRAARYEDIVVRTYQQKLAWLADRRAETIQSEGRKKWINSVQQPLWTSLGRAVFEAKRIRQREREDVREKNESHKQAVKAKEHRRAHPYGGDHKRKGERKEDPDIFSPPGRGPLDSPASTESSSEEEEEGEEEEGEEEDEA